MGNPYHGEVMLTVDGQELPMRLTLGALAELECGLECGSLAALVERFESGAFSTGDLIALLTAGLRGAGWQGGTADLAKAEVAGGPIVAATLAGRLLKLAFSLPE